MTHSQRSACGRSLTGELKEEHLLNCRPGIGSPCHESTSPYFALLHKLRIYLRKQNLHGKSSAPKDAVSDLKCLEPIFRPQANKFLKCTLGAR